MDECARRVAVGELVDQHYMLLYRFAFRLCGSVAGAEDLTQQTYLIAQSRLEQLRDRKHARGWLLAILRSVYLKGRRHKPMMPLNDLSEELVANPLTTEEVDAEQLQQLLQQMPEPFRITLMMFYFEEMSYEQIAENLGIPQGTVMSRLSRAKDFLRSRWPVAELHE